MTTVDPFSPAFADDRYRAYRELREAAPVAPVRLGPASGWLLSRYDDVLAVVRDHNMLVRRPGTGLADRLGDGPAARFAQVKMSMVDPPDHTRLRKLVAQAFTPRTVGQLRAEIERVSRVLLDELADRNEVDIVEDYAARLPASVLCAMTAVPDRDWKLLISKVEDFLPLLTPFPLDPATLARVDSACQFYLDYFGALIDDLRTGPRRDDLLGTLLAAEADGDRLSRDELIMTLESFVNAGYETTTSSIANGVLGLLTHREQFDKLRADPELLPGAVEEILRWEAPVQFTFRFAGHRRTLHDTVIEEGDLVLAGLGAANHDPRRFVDPGRLDVTRPDAGQLSFSAGRHVCLGAHLARLEARIALDQLLARFPHMALVSADQPRRANPMFPALERLPVILDPARKAA